MASRFSSGGIVEGFTFGKISDFEAEACTEVDAFVVAPDNSRAGLVWEVSGNLYFQVSKKPALRIQTAGAFGPLAFLIPWQITKMSEGTQNTYSLN
jgi:hypothetical protein